MKKANEMNKMAKEAIAKVEAERKAKAMAVIETVVEPAIEKGAKTGHFATACFIDNTVDIVIVMNELEENGYGVSRTGRMISINW